MAHLASAARFPLHSSLYFSLRLAGNHPFGAVGHTGGRAGWGLQGGLNPQVCVVRARGVFAHAACLSPPPSINMHRISVLSAVSPCAGRRSNERSHSSRPPGPDRSGFRGESVISRGSKAYSATAAMHACTSGGPAARLLRARMRMRDPTHPAFLPTCILVRQAACVW